MRSKGREKTTHELSIFLHLCIAAIPSSYVRWKMLDSISTIHSPLDASHFERPQHLPAAASLDQDKMPIGEEGSKDWRSRASSSDNILSSKQQEQIEVMMTVQIGVLQIDA